MKPTCNWWITSACSGRIAHFLTVSAQVMRRILVERTRRHIQKRGGGVMHVSLDEAAAVSGKRPTDLVALDDALNALTRFDLRQ